MIGVAFPRAVPILFLGLALCVLSGCSSKRDDKPIKVIIPAPKPMPPMPAGPTKYMDQGYPGYPGAPNRERITASSPDEALDLYAQQLRGGDTEGFLAILPGDSRKRMQEFIALNEQARQQDAVLQRVLDAHFWREEQPTIRPLAIDCGQALKFSARKLEFVATKKKSDQEVELTVKGAKVGYDEKEESTQFALVAVRELDGWKVRAPEVEEFAGRAECVARVLKAREQLIADIRADKLNHGKEIMPALTNLLRRGKAVAGTPEEAVEIYEAAQVAGDEQAYLRILDAQTRRPMERMFESSRRHHAIYLAYFDALEERFGSQAGADRYRQTFSRIPSVSPGVVQITVLGKEQKNDGLVEFKVRNMIYLDLSMVATETNLLVRKEDGSWKIGSEVRQPATEDKTVDDFSALFEPQARMIESLTKDIRAGKFKTIEEQRAAYREARGKLEETKNRDAPEKE